MTVVLDDLEAFWMGYDRNLSRRLKSFTCATLAVLCLLFMPSAFGQVDEGSVTGLVQDATGAVVPNAKVTLLNKDQGLSLQAVTDSAGSYTFSPVKIGTTPSPPRLLGFLSPPRRI